MIRWGEGRRTRTTAGPDLAYALRACPRTVINSQRPPRSLPANMKLGQALNPRATHENTLVMRRSLVSDEDLGAEAPTALRGTPLKSTEAYH
jgi:hypothetical protein